VTCPQKQNEVGKPYVKLLSGGAKLVKTLVIWGSLFPVEQPVPWYKILYQGDTEIFIVRSYLKDDPNKTSVVCSNLFVESNFPYGVFHNVKIDYLTNLEPYKNNSFHMTLKVQHKNKTVNWVIMKQSSI